jgi:type IV pilus assembly protein PilE
MKFYRINGFSLVELLVVVAILGIVTSIAYPSYVDNVVKSNRSEALREVLRIANLQEQYYVDSRKYTALMTDLGLSADPFITESGYYSIDATVSDATFVVTASALGTQATRDSACTTLQINEVGQKTATSTDCWGK